MIVLLKFSACVGVAFAGLSLVSLIGAVSPAAQATLVLSAAWFASAAFGAALLAAVLHLLWSIDNRLKMIALLNTPLTTQGDDL